MKYIECRRRNGSKSLSIVLSVFKHVEKDIEIPYKNTIYE